MTRIIAYENVQSWIEHWTNCIAVEKVEVSNLEKQIARERGENAAFRQIPFWKRLFKGVPYPDYDYEWVQSSPEIYLGCYQRSISAYEKLISKAKTLKPGDYMEIG